VFIIVLKNMLSVAWGLAGLFTVTLMIVAGIRIYKKYRNEK
jgi:putative membrane protein